MIAYMFRCTNDLSKSEFWIGIAIAPDLKSMFWQIDEHGDPYACEIRKIGASAKGASICVKAGGIEIGDDSAVDYLETELSNAITNALFDADDKWAKPVWPENIV